MSHVSQNLSALAFGPTGLTDPLLYHVIVTQQSMALVPGDGVILCRAVKQLSISLPQAATCAGRAFLVAKIDTSLNAVTIASRDMHDLVDGKRTFTLAGAFTAVLLLSDGQNWWTVGGGVPTLANPMSAQSIAPGITDLDLTGGSFIGVTATVGGLTATLPTNNVYDGTQLTIANMTATTFTLSPVAQGNPVLAAAGTTNSTVQVVWSAILGKWLKLSQA